MNAMTAMVAFAMLSSYLARDLPIGTISTPTGLEQGYDKLELPTLMDLLKRNMLISGIAWRAASLGIAGSALTHEESLAKLREELDARQKSEPQNEVVRLAKANTRSIEALFTKMQVFSGNEFSKVIYFTIAGLPVGNPIGFATFNQKLCFVISLGSASVFNSLRMDDMQRAVKAIETFILPSLEEFESIMRNDRIGYFGMTVTYGQRSFAGDETDSRAESVCFLWTKDFYQKYKQGQTTRQEFMRKALIFFSSNTGVVERIELPSK